MIQIRQEFTSDPTHLAELRGAVRECCRRAWSTGPRDEVVDRIVLAVQEAAANILIHAYRRIPGRPIRLEANANDEQVKLILTHDGADFDPSAVPLPSFDGSRSGGFGVYLINQCMDEVYYIHGDVGQRGIRLTKFRATGMKGTTMNLLVEMFGDLAVVTVNAEQLEVSNADEVRAGMDPVIRDCRKVVMDLNRVDFVDSRGCGVILSCLKHLAEKGGDLKLCRVTPPVRTVFDLIRLQKMCDITETREEAMKAFAS